MCAMYIGWDWVCVCEQTLVMMCMLDEVGCEQTLVMLCILEEVGCEQTLVILCMLDEVGWKRLMYFRQYAHPASIVTAETTTTTVTKVTVNQSPASADTEITSNKKVLIPRAAQQVLAQLLCLLTGGTRLPHPVAMGVPHSVLTGGFLHPVPTGGYPEVPPIGQIGVTPSSAGWGYPHQLDGVPLPHWPGRDKPPPPEMWIDRHLWKQYLNYSFGMRAVKIVF